MPKEYGNANMDDRHFCSSRVTNQIAANLLLMPVDYYLHAHAMSYVTMLACPDYLRVHDARIAKISPTYRISLWLPSTCHKCWGPGTRYLLLRTCVKHRIIEPSGSIRRSDSRTLWNGTRIPRDTSLP